MAPSLRITQAILAEVPIPAQGASLAAAQVVSLDIHIEYGRKEKGLGRRNVVIQINMEEHYVKEGKKNDLGQGT